MKTETINFPAQKIGIVPYSSNSEMKRDLEGRCGPRIFENPDRSGFPDIGTIMSDSRVIRQDYFNCDPCEITVRLVNPRDVGIIKGETFHQFSTRMKSEYDLRLLPTGVFPALCIDFNRRLFKKQTVLTKIFQLKIDNMWVHAVVTITNGFNNLPQIRLIQFDVKRELNIDFNYLFVDR